MANPSIFTIIVAIEVVDWKECVVQTKSRSIKSFALISLLLFAVYFALSPSQSFAIGSDAVADSSSIREGLVCDENGELKYYDSETGTMVTSRWYFDNNTGWYYFDADGTAATGWRYLAGNWYYFDSQHVMLSGRVQVDGQWYFLGAPGSHNAGKMQHSGWFYDSVSSTWGYASPSGALLTGWQLISGAWYYLDASGVMQVGWINDSGIWYYANASGAMVTGWLWAGDAWYYLNPSGAMRKGWLYSSGTWYWLDDNSGAMATGQYTCGSSKYIFDASGSMAFSRWVFIDGNWFYADPSGALHVGWLKLANTWYYFDPGTCVMATGLVSDNGYMYACGSSGGMISGWAFVNGHWYYAGDGGALFRGKWLLSGGKWYYFDNASCEMKTGLIDVGDTRYFALDSGVMATSEWVFFEGGCAWASASGVLSESFSQSSDGAPLLAHGDSLPGPVHVGDSVFFADVNGEVNTHAGWNPSSHLSNDKSDMFVDWYFADTNGVLATGWRFVDGYWYWFEPSSFRMKRGWLNQSGAWYWLQDSGAMFENGWLVVDGAEAYFSKSGVWVNPSGSVLGVGRRDLLRWLTSHEDDGYYRGTRYDTRLNVDICIYPNGSPRWDGWTAMNCGGFVAHAYKCVGGDLSPIAIEQNHSPWSRGPGRGSYLNAYRWYGYAIDSHANIASFNSIEELLRSGLARKGDLVFFYPYNPYVDDCHIGFFWGNTSGENLFWHSDCFGNRISGLTSPGYSKVYLIR